MVDDFVTWQQMWPTQAKELSTDIHYGNDREMACVYSLHRINAFSWSGGKTIISLKKVNLESVLVNDRHNACF